MGTLSKNFGKLTMPLLVLAVICLFAVQAQGQYGGGKGEPNEPYLISTPAQMNAIGADPCDWDKHFRLMANINLGGYTGASFNKIGVWALGGGNPFTGVFDGNGHTISNFNYTTTETYYIGLFGYVAGDSAEVKNLGLVNPNVDSATGRSVGSLVGSLGGGTITGCYTQGGSVSGDVGVGGLVGSRIHGLITNCHSTASVSGDWEVGGLVGGNNGIITNCYSAGNVSGVIEVGGLVGTILWDTIITNCYSTGNVSGTTRVGGLVGSNGSVPSASGGGMIANCYSTGSVSGDESVGGLVGLNYRDQRSVILRCYSVGSVLGTTNVGGLLGLNDGGTVYGSFWDKQNSGRSNMCGGQSGSASGCDDGNGKTTAEMQDVSTFMGAGWDFVGEYENGPSDEWAEPAGGGYMILWWQLDPLPPLPTFSGGAGTESEPYLISNGTDLNRIGHNPRLMEADFRLTNDIDLAGVDFFPIGIRGLGYSGVFDGNGHTISNFTYSSTVTNNVGLFGAITGKNAEVKDLGLINPNINAGEGDYVGSLVGLLTDGAVSGCYVDGGSVSGGGSVGGLVGSNTGTITDCHSSGIVSATNEYVGGLVGFNDGTITNSYSTGSVSGTTDVGGLVGMSRYSDTIVSNCFSAGSVSGNSNVGGLVGYNAERAILINCYSLGSVLATGNYVGGLAGATDGFGFVTNCYSTGGVTGVDRVGGLVGWSRRSTITNSYATGSVSGIQYVGGLVGFNYGDIKDCYAMGEVTGVLDVGGLVGENGYDSSICTITNCYSAGPISGAAYVGGLLGNNDGEVSGSFWDVQTSGLSNMCGRVGASGSGCDDGNGKTTAEMQTESTFSSAGWDFVGETANGTEDIWKIREGVDYARLAWQLFTGDFDGDGKVDFTDFAILGAQWRQPPGEPSADIAPDGGDGIVDWFDLAALADNWLAGPPPGQAINPHPADGATGVSTTADLSWTAGTRATSHDVYFGTNPTPDVNEFIGNQTSITLDPGTLDYETSYYWRVDEVNAWGTTTGTLWYFTTMGPPPP